MNDLPLLFIVLVLTLIGGAVICGLLLFALNLIAPIGKAGLRRLQVNIETAGGSNPEEKIVGISPWERITSAENRRKIQSRGHIILNEKLDPEEQKRIAAAELHRQTLIKIEAQLEAERIETARLKAQRLEEDRLEAEREAKEAQRQAEIAQREERSWDSLILPHETKEQLKTYCLLLSNHAWYAEQGINPPRGLMLYGPPGCGKTETARFLRKKAGFAFVSLSSADLKVGWIGQAAVAIQNAFAAARAKAPCIVYIDEIDASCPTRASGANSVIDNEVNAQLLQELDGINTTDTQPVFVFASTNRMDLIDPAILQRFTEHIEIALPNNMERIELLKIFIGKIPIEVSVPEDGDLETYMEALGYSIEEFTFQGEGPRFVLTFLRSYLKLDAECLDDAIIAAWEEFSCPDMIVR